MIIKFFKSTSETKIFKKFFLIFFLYFLCFFSSYSSEYVRPESYDLKVQIEPDSGNISVQCELKIHLLDHLSKQFDFDLHGTFQVDDLKINGRPAEYSQKENKPWVIFPCSKKITIGLPEDKRKQDVSVDIAYHGRLKSIPEFGSHEGQKLALDDQINPRMVELASYSCWYPLFEFGNRYDIKLELSLPDGWQCVCSGKEIKRQRKKEKILSYWSSSNDTDIIIIASPFLKLKTYKGEDFDIHIYHTQMPSNFIDREFAQIEKTVGLYTNLLGKAPIPGGIIKHVFSPKLKGQGGAGIARPGMIVTSEGLTLESLKKDPGFSLFHGIAHEIAHFWWNFGASQGDWINETFAEYFSSVADQKIISEETIQNDLNKYLNLTHSLPKDAPALSVVPFKEGKINYIVRYYKGSLMLNSLRKQMGDSNFFMTCHDFYQTFSGDLIGTTEFREFWGKRLGKNKNLLIKWLDSEGGVPEYQMLIIGPGEYLK